MAEESTLQGKILRDLDSHGYDVKATKVHKCSDSGWPDVLFTSILHGPGMVETKSSIGVLSKKQIETIDRLRKAGMKVYVVNSWKQWLELRKSIVGG